MGGDRQRAAQVRAGAGSHPALEEAPLQSQHTARLARLAQARRGGLLLALRRRPQLQQPRQVGPQGGALGRAARAAGRVAAHLPRGAGRDASAAAGAACREPRLPRQGAPLLAGRPLLEHLDQVHGRPAARRWPLWRLRPPRGAHPLEAGAAQAGPRARGHLHLPRGTPAPPRAPCRCSLESRRCSLGSRRCSLGSPSLPGRWAVAFPCGARQLAYLGA